MKIKESKNLRYDRLPRTTDSFEEDNVFEPKHCIVIAFQMTIRGLELNFRNGSQAYITAKHGGGAVELEMIAGKMKDFVGKSYEEILNTDF